MPDRQQQQPVTRQATPAEELAKLHPIERVTFRLFERLASLRLAVLLMLWLMLECIIGTVIESAASTAAARYFVYGTLRFTILLGLLGLNILCAALIRFPWRRHQTGFVVTHFGLLVLLVGSMMTAVNNVDAVMSVSQGQTERTIIDPDEERIVVRYHDPQGESDQEVIPVNFGPFTWGQRLLWGYSWRKDYVEEHRLKNGDLLRIKRYLANCEPQPTYVADEHGEPAIRYRVSHHGAGEMTRWISVSEALRSGREGLVTAWPLGTQGELDHFLQAVPKQAPAGPGTLGYSHVGKHYTFAVASLLKHPTKIPGTDITIEVTEYLPNAVPQGPNLINEGEDPKNPAVKVEVKVGDQTPLKLHSFARWPQFNTVLAHRNSTEHLISFFRADDPMSIQLVTAPDGSVGYRAFENGSLVTAERVQPDKEYAAPMGLRFTVLQLEPHARPDLLLRPRPANSGQQTMRGIVAELVSGDDVLTTSLLRSQPPRTGRLGERTVSLQYTVAQRVLPFAIRLDDFEEPKNPGTMQAAMYTSKVTLIDKSRDIERKEIVTMNAPLYYTGIDGMSYTFYQSGISRSNGVPLSTFSVANDPGLSVKYAGATIMSVGIFLMFYMGGYFKPSRRNQSAAEQIPASATTDQAAGMNDRSHGGE